MISNTIIDIVWVLLKSIELSVGLIELTVKLLSK